MKIPKYCGKCGSSDLHIRYNVKDGYNLSYCMKCKSPIPIEGFSKY